MVKVHTIEMIEHSANSTPYVTAHADMINGALVSLGTNNTTAAPATGKELYIVLNTQVGDKEYAREYPIKAGEFVNLFKLSSWVGKEINVTEENFVSTSGVAVGNEITFDATTFKFKKASATTGDVAFTVTATINGGFRLLIKIK